MVHLHLCLPFHEVLSSLVLSDPFSIGITNSEAKVNNVGVQNFFTVSVFKFYWDVDIPFFVDQGRGFSIDL